jgi:hypothetical protein
MGFQLGGYYPVRFPLDPLLTTIGKYAGQTNASRAALMEEVFW